MEKIKAVYKNAWPYQEDKMNLPVKDLYPSISFYETIMAFRIVLRKDEPYKSVILERDSIQIGLAQNGGDPSQDGCFFEVNDVEAAFAELKSNGLRKEIPGFNIERHGETSWKVFYVVAPDELCYCIGQRQN